MCFTGIGELFQARQRVEHRDVGNIPALRKLHTSNAREPVMAVQEIVLSPFTAPERVNLLRKRGEILIEVVFGNRPAWPGLDMHDPYVRAELNYLWCLGMGPTSKDINGCVALS